MADLKQERNIGVWKAYGAFWKHYADFGSRTSKEAFWKAYFIQFIILLAMFSPAWYAYESLIERNDIFAFLWLLPFIVYCFATFVPMIAIVIRRLHDTDRNGAWFFLFLVPVAGLVVFIVMLSRPSARFDVYPGQSGSGPYPQPYPYAPPYGQTRSPYAPPQYSFRPPPRRFAPKAGGNKATAAIVLTIIVMVSFNAYSIVCSNYVQNNMNRIFDFGFNSFIADPFDGFSDDPYYWGEEPWDGETPWNETPGIEGNGEEQMTDDEMAAIDLVRESVLEGFPDFSIEEVLLSRVEKNSLEWNSFADDGGEYPAFYVYATGYVIGDFVMIYAGFDVYEDGTIELFNLDDGNYRDLYYEEAREMYKEWYETMFSGVDNAAA